MTRIDWLVLRRFAYRIAITVMVFFALFALVGTLDTGRIRMLSALGGPLLSAAGIALSALRSSIGILPITALLGTIAAVLDLQSRRELTIILSTGHSIWSVARAPILAMVVFSAVMSIGGETLIILANRAMPGYSGTTTRNQTWLEQSGKDGRYILRAAAVTANPPAIYDATIFLTDTPSRDRIEAEEIALMAGHWRIKAGTRYTLAAAPEPLVDFDLATTTTVGDLRLIASGARDLTLPELLQTQMSALSDSGYRSVTSTSLLKSFTLPFMVAGTMLIGIAVAGRYRRRMQYANTILFGIVGGFVIYVLNEMAVRAGNAEVLPPLVAAAGPAFVAVLVGLTTLLYSQDGTMRR